MSFERGIEYKDEDDFTHYFNATQRLSAENRELRKRVTELERQLEEARRGVQPIHRCRPIARAVMAENRDWWIGELLEPVSEWPKETHCLHMKTPIKSVVFLCNSGDFEQLLVMSNVIVRLKNLSWLEHAMDGAKIRSLAEKGSGDNRESVIYLHVFDLFY